MTGVIYARYSEGPRQTDQSIEGQVRDCMAFAKSKGIEIVEIYADRHVSGKSIDGRDEFQRMMRDADRHIFGCVIVWKIDRFGRSREDIAVNKIKLRKAGVTLMYAKESVPDGPEGILLEALLEGLAEYYSADLRQKVNRGLDESARKGKWPNGILPPGYAKDSDGHVILDPEKAAAVQEAFRMHIAEYPQDEILKYLGDHGILSRKGNYPGQAMLYRILRNERYLGNFSFHGISVPAPAIIDKNTFDAAKDHFKTSRWNGRGNADVEYLLSCKCHCGYCGKLLNGETGTGKSGRSYHYYKCRGAKRGGNCELKAIPQQKLEEIVISRTISDVLSDDLIESLTDKIMALQIRQQNESPENGLKKRLRDIQKREDNLVTAIENGGSASLSERLRALEEEEEKIKVEISRAELKKPIIPREIISGWLQSFRSGDKDSPAFRKKLVDTFVADVVVMNDEVTIFYNIEKEPHTECSCTARLLEFANSYTNPGLTLFDRFIVLKIVV